MFGPLGTERPRRTPTCGHALSEEAHPPRDAVSSRLTRGSESSISAAVVTLGGPVAAGRSPERVRHGKIVATPKRGTPRPRCIRREWKALGPSCASVEGDDEGLVSFEGFDQCQTVLPPRPSRRWQERRPDRDRARRRMPMPHVHRVVWCEDRSGGRRARRCPMWRWRRRARRAGKMCRHLGVDNADPEWFGVFSASGSSGCLRLRSPWRPPPRSRRARRARIAPPNPSRTQSGRPHLASPTDRTNRPRLRGDRVPLEDLCHLGRGLPAGRSPPDAGDSWGFAASTC